MSPRIFPALLLLLLATTPAVAQELAAPIPPTVRNQLYVDEPGDGRIWVRGATYKASFGAEGATFIPFFGSHAAENHPIAFSMWSVKSGDEALAFDHFAAPRLDGDAVVFDRGLFVERWDLSLETVEQSFAFKNSDVRGELAVELIAFTDLDTVENGDEIRFESDLGHVQYSRPLAFDREGRYSPVAADIEGSWIRLTVPAAFVDGARTPITIDPVLTVFPIHTLAEEQWQPDVAHDATTDRWITVYEERFSATDIDVFARLLSSGGADLGGQYVDMTSTVWAVPHVANNNVADQFLAVATVGDPTGGARTVRGRTIAAATGTMGLPLNINGLLGGDQTGVVVGGDPAPSGTTYYCVAWQKPSPAHGDGNIHYRLVRADGSYLQAAPAVLDDTTSDESGLCISRSNGNPPAATQNWNLAWRSELLTFDSVRGAQIHRDGTITTSPFTIDQTAGDQLGVSVSSPQDAASGPRGWLVAWYRPLAGHTDILARLVVGSTPQSQYDLSSLEDVAGSGAFFRDQYSPQVECDGTHFVVAYTEIDEQSDHDIYAATFTLVGTGPLRVTEAHQPLGQTTSHEDYAGLAARRQSGSTSSARFLAAWSRSTASGKDVHGGLYDAPVFHSFCIPGQDGPPCPCINPPIGARGCNNSANTGGALLLGGGMPSISADTVTLTTTGELPNAPSLVVQGSAIVHLTFGQGVRCSGGSLVRMYTKTASGGSITVPGPGDPSLSARSAAAGHPLIAGLSRNYFVYYRAPIVLGGCAPTSTFNTSQALYVTWWP